MKTDFKKEQKQLKKLLGNDYENISIILTQKSKVKDEYHNIGDIVSSNEHFLHHMFEMLNRPKSEKMSGFGGGYIDGFEIPFKDYEINIGGWFGDDSERIPSNWYETEKKIGEILGLKIHQYKNELVDIDDELPF